MGLQGQQTEEGEDEETRVETLPSEVTSLWTEEAAGAKCTSVFNHPLEV